MSLGLLVLILLIFALVGPAVIPAMAGLVKFLILLSIILLAISVAQRNL